LRDTFGPGQTNFLLDRLLGLERHSRMNRAVKKRAAALASRMTYREASTVLSDAMGTKVSAQSVPLGCNPWASALRKGCWAQHKLPPPPEVVGAEWDEALLRSQEEGEKSLS
jgi:hypothetical protein